MQRVSSFLIGCVLYGMAKIIIFPPFANRVIMCCVMCARAIFGKGGEKGGRWGGEGGSVIGLLIL